MSSSLVSLDLGVLLPVLAPVVGAAAVLVVDVAAPRLRLVHYVMAWVALALGAVATVPGLAAVPGDARTTLCLPGSAQGALGGAARCLYAAGSVASALQLAALLGAAIALLVAWPQDAREPQGRTAVTVSLVLAATAGAVAVAAARDLGSWLVALELATLPTIGLVALRGTRQAVSGAVALLTTSLVSFALLAMAAACWYAATASPFLDAGASLAAAGVPARRALLVLAVVLAVAGIGFKLSLVPFHAWTPEAYDGAPLGVATFLAGTSKVAALGALLAVLRAVTPLGASALTAVAVVAALSMTLGNVMALRQRDVLRLLAWSTVAQAGWVVLPLAAVSTAAVSAASAYLLSYVVATLLVFAVVAAVGRLRGGGAGAGRDLSAYRGLLGEHRLLAAALGLGLLSLAGLPPGVLGLVAKVVALRPVVAGQLWLLAVVAAVNAVLGVAVYLRWFAVVLDRADGSGVRRPAATPAIPPSVQVAVSVALAVLVATSVAPQILLGLLG